jgi:DNA-binding transcriptional regulator YdaS (Cro superfamily)
MQIDALLDAAKATAEIGTDSALAARLGVTKQAVSN